MSYGYKNILNLGIKEIRGVFRDVFLMILIVFTFTLDMISYFNSSVDAINDAAIAIVDEDCSPLSMHMSSGLLPPYFAWPVYIERDEMDAYLDQGISTFVVNFPANFQQDYLHGLQPKIQLNIDATRMQQAFTGTGYIKDIFQQECDDYMSKDMPEPDPITLITHYRYNSNLTTAWFDVLMQLSNMVTLLAIVLTGSALIRERERGTLEHLMVMPVTPFQIMTSKIWSMGLVVWVSSTLSLFFVIKGYLQTPTNGSLPLFFVGSALHLFAMTSMGIFLACIANSMPHLGMLMILVLLPLQMLSGGSTPQESMPEPVQYVMLFAPTTHFVRIIEAILIRGAGLDTAWNPFLWLFGLGAGMFSFSLTQFKKSLA